MVYCLFIRQGQKVKKKGKRFLLFVYLAGLGKLKERQKVVYCLLIGRAGKFKRKAKGRL